MNYSEIVDKVRDQIRDSIFETTTEDAVSFIPSHLGMVKAKVSDLAKKKKDWKIEILETEDNKEVIFEEELRVLVPNEHWDSFCSIFNSSPTNNTYLNLGSLLNETMEEEMEDLRRELRVSLAHLYDEAEFRQLNLSSGSWKWRFGVRSYDTRSKGISTAIVQESRLKDIQNLYKKILEVYGEDRGNLEMVTEAIKDKAPLNTFKVFKNYDFLYATRIHSRYEKVDLFFEATVDNDYHLSSTIYTNNKELLSKIEEESKEVKVVRTVIYPKGGVFTSRFLQLLSDVIEDLGEDNEE